MKLLRNNKKLILGIMIGLVLSSIGVYATSEILFQSSQVSFDNTRANLTKSNGDPVETVEEAVEALARNVTPICNNSPFQVGDYIDMTPTSSSYAVDQNLRSDDGSATAVTLDPSELNVWRVIKVNSDCTVEVVSEYVSTQTVEFKAKNGYLNYVYVLNEIAKQYANTTYTLDPATASDGAFRNVGYDDQTKQITNTTRIDDTTLGTSSGAWYQKTTALNREESLGGGDNGFGKDVKLLYDAGVSLVAYKISTPTIATYWLASRVFIWISTSGWYFNLRFSGNSGVGSGAIWYWNGSNYIDGAVHYSVRPIVTLKSGLTTSSENGTSSSHYQLSVS